MRSTIFALLCGGCGVLYPANRPVAIELSSDLAGCSLALSDGRPFALSEVVGEAVRYWDVVGANFRAAGDLTEEELRRAPRLPVRGDVCSELGRDSDSASPEAATATYNQEGSIYLHLRVWPKVLDDYDRVAADSTVAHELGHALGLGHLSDENAVMYRSAAVRTDLSPADVAAFKKLEGWQ